MVQNNSEKESNQHTDEQMKSKTDQQKVHRTSPKQKTQTSQKERKNKKNDRKKLTTGAENRPQNRPVQNKPIEIMPNHNFIYGDTTLLTNTYSPLSITITITSKPPGQK